MFQCILVPLDGSTRAERALTVAAHLARESCGTVALVRVVPQAARRGALKQASTLPIARRSEAELAHATRYLDHVAGSPVLQDLPVHKQVLFGPAAETILSVARANQSDLIIICRRGEAGLSRSGQSRVSEQIVHRSVVPVLLLHERGPIPTGSHLDGSLPFCALLPLDGTMHAQAVIEPAVHLVTALAAPAQAKLQLLRVVPTGATPPQIQQAKTLLAMAAFRMYREGAAHLVKQHRLVVNWSIAVSDEVSSAILYTAEAGEGINGAGILGRCDLIALATQERSSLQRWSRDSVTGRVLHESRLPVLVVRATPVEPDLVENQHTPAVAQKLPG